MLRRTVRVDLAPRIFRCYSAEAAAVKAPAGDEAAPAGSSTKKKRPQRHTLKTSSGAPPAPLNVHHAVDFMKKACWARFDESIEVAVRLGVDPRKPNQAIKGIASLPHGTGKSIRIGVFANGLDADTAVNEGADVVGGADLIAKIQESGGGAIAFDRVIATPEMMPALSKIGRILGPRGLMPNPKMGSVTNDVAAAIRQAKIGTVTFRVDKVGIVHAPIGKRSFPTSKLLDNLRSFMMGLSDAKPEGLKGKYITSVSIASTMGPGVPVDVASADPSSSKFMLEPTKLGGAATAGGQNAAKRK